MPARSSAACPWPRCSAATSCEARPARITRPGETASGSAGRNPKMDNPADGVPMGPGAPGDENRLGLRFAPRPSGTGAKPGKPTLTTPPTNPSLTDEHRPEGLAEASFSCQNAGRMCNLFLFIKCYPSPFIAQQRTLGCGLQPLRGKNRNASGQKQAGQRPPAKWANRTINLISRRPLPPAAHCPRSGGPLEKGAGSSKPPGRVSGSGDGLGMLAKLIAW